MSFRRNTLSGRGDSLPAGASYPINGDGEHAVNGVAACESLRPQDANSVVTFRNIKIREVRQLANHGGRAQTLRTLRALLPAVSPRSLRYCIGLSLTAKLAKFLSPTQLQSTAVEAAHWNEIERRAKLGDRIFWLNHPRVWHHYHRKSPVPFSRKP